MTRMHASAVAVDGRGILILGAPGTGKSSLALQLMAMGARLVADDQILLAGQDGTVIARCPQPLSGCIEARGVGILNADPFGPAHVALVVDLDQAESDRLPPFRTITILGVTLPLVLGPLGPHLAAALRQLVMAGRRA